jgi:hypothetical protein
VGRERQERKSEGEGRSTGIIRILSTKHFPYFRSGVNGVEGDVDLVLDGGGAALVDDAEIVG